MYSEHGIREHEHVLCHMALGIYHDLDSNLARVRYKTVLKTNDNQDTLILLFLFVRLERQSKYLLQTINKRDTNTNSS